MRVHAHTPHSLAFQGKAMEMRPYLPSLPPAPHSGSSDLSASHSPSTLGPWKNNRLTVTLPRNVRPLAAPGQDGAASWEHPDPSGKPDSICCVTGILEGPKGQGMKRITKICTAVPSLLIPSLITYLMPLSYR